MLLKLIGPNSLYVLVVILINLGMITESRLSARMIIKAADRVILFIEPYASQDHLRYTKLRIPVVCSCNM